MLDEEAVSVTPELLILDYETLYNKYHQQMTEKLRNFNGDIETLQYWVPVPNLEESLAGLFQSLLEAGHNQAKIMLREEVAGRLDRSRLTELLSRDGGVLGEQKENDRIALYISLSGDARRASGLGLVDAAGRRAAARVTERQDIARRFHAIAAVPVEPVKLNLLCLSPLQALPAGDAAEQGDIAEHRIHAEGMVDAVILRLEVEVEGHKVVAAKHLGTSSPTACLLLDTFCRFAIGNPVQELADHGANRFAALLKGRDALRPGINHPRAIDPAFRWLEHLVRAAAVDWRRQAGIVSQTNEYDLPPAAAWSVLSPSEQLRSLRDIIWVALQSNGFAADAAEVATIEHGVRVVIQFADGFPGAQRARLLLLLEREIKKQADARLEVQQQERWDDNVLRRLKQGEDK